jgi:RNA polymerase sigma factor (sigma-70 family)
LNDNELISSILNGNSERYDDIVERYQSGIYRTAYYYTQNPEDAQDIAQEIFIRAYNSLAGFKQDSTFSTWLYRIAVNLCLDWCRKKKPPLAVPTCLDHQFAKGNSPEEMLLHKEAVSEIQKAIGSLQEIYRTALILYYLEDFSPQEIADIMETSKRTIETRLFRGRKLLRDKLRFSSSGGDGLELLSEQR